MTKTYAILKNRFNDNYVLINMKALTMEGDSITQYWSDEMRWKSWGTLKTDNPLIVNNPAFKETGVLAISPELLFQEKENVKRVYGVKRDFQSRAE